MALQGQYGLKDALNRCLPVAKRAGLGDWMFAMETAVQSLLSLADVGAAVDAGLVTVFGTGTITVASTITTGDSFKITLVNAAVPALVSPGIVIGPVPVLASDTLTLIAARCAAALNASTVLTNLGYAASSAVAVVTLHGPGVAANSTVITAQLSAGATLTVTPTTVTSGAGAVVARSSLLTPIPTLASKV